MTLTQRMALFIAFILSLALGGALVIHTLAARDALLQQQDVRNRDAAASLALALSQHGADVVAMKTIAAAQFDLGHYRQIRLVAPDGQVLWNLQAGAAQTAGPARAPAWFVRWLPVVAADGEALVSAGWRELGTLSVAAHTSWAQDSLWRASQRTAALLAGLALCAAALTAWMLRAWQRPLQDTVEQAQALARGQFVEAPLPRLPELQSLTRSMNTTVLRLRENFAGQAEQVAYLQRQAQLEPLTGLCLRAQFMETMNRRLAHQDGVGLVLVRVGPLERINALYGREAADSVLRQAGQVLARLADAEPDSLAARLSGSDMAWLLPLPGIANELAPGLLHALRDALLPLGLGVQVAVSVSGNVSVVDAETALSMAMPGLAQAAQGDGLHLGFASHAGAAFTDLAAWTAQIGSALDERRASIAEFPVLDPQGRLLHLECPLRLQLDPDGEYQSAAKWLPLARRCGLSARVDLRALQLALAAAQADARPRAVNVELASLTEPGFVAEVANLLAAHADAANLLWVEWVQSGARGDWVGAEQASHSWRQWGVRIGVEHAGAEPQHLAQLRDQGLDYVKVDAGHLRGAAADARVRAYAQSLSGLIRLLGLKVLAEGVENNDDLQVLWSLGFDGATGKALSASLAPLDLKTSAMNPTRAASESGPRQAATTDFGNLG
jgi:EAL domain-containing protein (putative c-di-GMP-specific phosphodiesterase class I)/GGDEF domain-containing protein